MSRVLEGGGWTRALHFAQQQQPSYRPWVVLVCGLNGVRKTTATYQSWFPELLARSLRPPASSASSSQLQLPRSELPCGNNSFFRQLDYVIATAANQEFKTLYELVPVMRQELGDHEKEVSIYSAIKSSIFSRYRTLAELFGVLLLQECQKQRVNAMLETSGRDIGMYHYVNSLFPRSLGYRKLLLHFSVDHLSCAKESVSTRMAKEMTAGEEAVCSGDVQKIVWANMGGPYGPEALPKVLEEEQVVWKQVLADAAVGKGVIADWYTASIDIKAFSLASGRPWTAQVGTSPMAPEPLPASNPTFTFEKPPNSRL
eukprot:g11364.t1